MAITGTSHEDGVLCPNCGHVDRAWRDMGLSCNGDTADVDCRGCGVKLTVTHVAVPVFEAEVRPANGTFAPQVTP